MLKEANAILADAGMTRRVTKEEHGKEAEQLFSKYGALAPWALACKVAFYHARPPEEAQQLFADWKSSTVLPPETVCQWASARQRYWEPLRPCPGQIRHHTCLLDTDGCRVYRGFIGSQSYRLVVKNDGRVWVDQFSRDTPAEYAARAILDWKIWDHPAVQVLQQHAGTAATPDGRPPFAVLPSFGKLSYTYDNLPEDGLNIPESTVWELQFVHGRFNLFLNLEADGQKIAAAVKAEFARR